MVQKKLLLLYAFLWLGICNAQHANEVYGKNKIQYNDDQQNWWIYETNNFIIYWYGKSRFAAQFCISLVEHENQEAQKLFEYHLKDKIELILYSDKSDLHQTNIQLPNNLDNWDKEPKIKDQKILLSFDGDHHTLSKMLRKGILQVYFNSMFTGTNLKEAVQKVISLKLPEWYDSGLIQYLSEGWSNENLLEMKTHWNQVTKFKKFAQKAPQLAGHSFWHFLTQIYGRQIISNWLYMTRIQKDVNKASRMVFNQSLSQLEKQWMDYYIKELVEVQNFISANKDKDWKKINLKKDEQVFSLQYSEIYQKFVVTTQQLGKKRIRILDTKSGKTKTIHRSGSKTNLFPPSGRYPLYAETENNSYIIVEKQNKLVLYYKRKQDPSFIKHILPENIQQVFSFIAIDKSNLLLSASDNGFSDLFIYSITQRQFNKLTDDIWDDLGLQNNQYEGQQRIYYSSNRPTHDNITNTLDSTLPLLPNKVYSYLLSQDKKMTNHREELNVPYLNKWFAVSEGIFYTQKGAQVSDLLFKENENSEHWLSFYTSIDQMCKDPNHNSLMLIKKHKNGYYFTVENNNNHLHKVNIKPEIIFLKDSLKQKLDPNTESLLLTDTLFFQSPFGNPGNILELIAEFSEKKTKKIPAYIGAQENTELEKKYNTIPFNSSLAIAYRPRYFIEELSSEIQNNLLFDGLNTYSGSSETFNSPPIGVLFKLKTQEVFENISLEAGIRIPTIFNGSESYILLDDKRKRLDYKYAIYRKATKDDVATRTLTDQKLAKRTTILNHQVLFAFNHFEGIRLNSTFRNDHQFYLITDKGTLRDSNDIYQQRIGSRLEYVFDNALDRSVNIKTGWQAKVFFEYSKRLEFNYSNNFKVKFPKGSLLLAGVDLRYHFPILKKSVWSNRIFAHTNFGSNKILYHIGGTENWILPKYETESGFIKDGNYVYSGLATEVRGFNLGARKASSFFLLTTELRIPFMQYLLNQNWKNSFFRNFQCIAYIDYAFTWDGFLPSIHSSETVEYSVQNNKVKVDLQFSRSPYIAGIGFGFRTSIFGYFIRYDHAWKWFPSGLMQPISHISLGLDF